MGLKWTFNPFSGKFDAYQNLEETIPLEDLNDVAITSVADRDLLTYDAASGEWVNSKTLSTLLLTSATIAGQTLLGGVTQVFATPTVDISASVVAQYKMNDNAASTTVIDSVNGYNGVAQRNTNLLTSTGKINSALSFNGVDTTGDWINCGKRTQWETDTTTIACWFKPTGGWSSGSIKYLFECYTGTNNRCALHLWNTGKLWFYTVGGSPAGSSIYSDSTSWNDQWYHLVLECGANGMKMWVDNVLQSDTKTTTWTPNSGMTNPTLFIGKTSTSSAYRFYGSIDNFMWIGKSLSDDERAFLYSAGTGTEALNNTGTVIDIHGIGSSDITSNHFVTSDLNNVILANDLEVQNDAYIDGDAYINNISATNATITTLTSSSALIDSIVGTNATITTLTSSSALIDSIVGTNATITALTAGTARLGDATNYTYVESSGTLVFNGNATVWDDFPPNPIIGAKLGATAPTLAAFVSDVEQLTFDDTNDYVIGSTEIPHNWKEGTTIYPHIHWATNGTNATDRGVQWQLKWTVGDGTEVFSAQVASVVDVTIPLATADRTHFINEFATTMDGTNLRIGAVICWRLERIETAHANGAPAVDPFGLSIGFHGEMDTVGSRQRFIK